MFHIMYKENDHPELPQSEVVSRILEFVQRGYSMALQQRVNIDKWLRGDLLTSRACTGSIPLCKKFSFIEN